MTQRNGSSCTSLNHAVASLVKLLAAAVSLNACGSDAGPSAGAQTRCERSTENLLTGALAAERAIVARGRADSGMERAFGAESERLLDDADAQRGELIEQAAHDLGVDLGAMASECPAATIGSERAPLSPTAVFAFGVTAKALADAVKKAPVEGTMTSTPYMNSKAGVAADGSAKTSLTTFNLIVGGHDSVVTVTTTMSTEVTTGAGATTESAYVAASVDVCPDSGGLARGNVVVVIDGSALEGASYHGESNQSFDFVVNDQANVVATEITSALSYRASGARSAEVTAHGNGRFSGESNDFDGGDAAVDHSDGSAESEALVRSSLLSFGLSTATLVRQEASAKWRGGTCVEVQAEPSSDQVDADTELEITATPRHKFDMSNVDAPVVATLSGVSSIDKAGERVPAPATYHYVAGSHFRDRGVVQFKSTSKRGIGQGSSTITVKCDEDMMCPEGRRLNLESCECECADVEECPQGRVWDEDACACVCETKECAAGERWDTERCECVCALVCPPGQTLNEADCRCEASCDIDPMLGNPSLDCVWVGSVNVTASEGGSKDLSSPGITRTVTWSLSYDAALRASDPGLASPQIFLKGAVSGSWEQVDVSEYPDLSCSVTETQTAAVSSQLDDGAYLTLVPDGTGKLTMSFYLGTGADLIGTSKLSGSGGICEGADPEYLGLSVGGFSVSARPSSDSFNGSADVEQGSFYLPEGRYAPFHVTWDLRLVRK